MIIKASEIKSNDIQGIIRELENMPEVMDIIRGYNLRGGDFLEAIASDMFYNGNDINTDDYLDIK